MKNNMSAKRLALIGMLGALGAILMMFRFPIPFMPPFLSFDLAAIPELIGAFALGPVAGVLIVFIRVMVQMVISGSNSMFTGELQSFLLGVAKKSKVGKSLALNGTGECETARSIPPRVIDLEDGSCGSTARLL